MTQTEKRVYDVKFIRDLAYRILNSSGSYAAINYLLDVIEMLISERDKE